MGVGIGLVDKVGVIGANEFHVQFTGKLYQGIIDKTLLLIGLMVSPCHGCFVALQLEIVVIAKHVLEPLDGLACLVHLSAHDELRNLATQASRTTDDALVILLELAVIGAGVHVFALGPRM